MRTGDFIRLRLDVQDAIILERLYAEGVRKTCLVNANMLFVITKITPECDYELEDGNGQRYLLRGNEACNFEAMFVGRQGMRFEEDCYYRCLWNVVCEEMDMGFQIVDRVWLSEGTLIYIMSCEEVDVIASAMGVSGVVRLNPSDAIFFERVNITPTNARGKDEVRPQPAPGGDDTMTWYADAGDSPESVHDGELHD